MENPAEVTIVDFGPRGWVLVTYEKKYLKLVTEANPEGGGKVRSLDQLRPRYRRQTRPTRSQVSCQSRRNYCGEIGGFGAGGIGCAGGMGVGTGGIGWAGGRGGGGIGVGAGGGGNGVGRGAGPGFGVPGPGAAGISPGGVAVGPDGLPGLRGGFRGVGAGDGTAGGVVLACGTLELAASVDTVSRSRMGADSSLADSTGGFRRKTVAITPIGSNAGERFISSFRMQKPTRPCLPREP